MRTLETSFGASRWRCSPPNRPEWIVAALAILPSRASWCRWTPSPGAHLVRDRGARRLFTVRDHPRHRDELRNESHPEIVLAEVASGFVNARSAAGAS